MDYETHEYDVLVVGAGGAGLRAAIEASAGGVKVGLLCKSLLGKAHTVMAEGGIAAALANVDDRDSWKVHFADTMRGGQYVNNWRMAELHAKEAPDRVRELEAWGAVFDRTADGRILQRNFGGHRYPRLAHVGDRTGLEMIRTLQDHGVHRGIDVHMEFTVVSLLNDGGRIAGVFGYERERGRFKVFRAPARDPGDRRPRARLPDHQQQLGRHRRRPLAGVPRRRRADRHGVHPVPSDRHDLAAERPGHPRHRRRARRRGILLNKEGRRFMFDDIPEPYRNQTADNEDEGWRYTQGDKSARRPPELLTRDHVARCINREVREGRGSPHGGVFLDIAWIKKRMPNAEEHIRRKLPEHVSPVQAAGRHRHHEGADGSRPDDALRDGRCAGRLRIRRCPRVPGLFAAGECAAGINGANRLGGNSLSDLLVFGKRAGEYAATFAREQRAAGVSMPAQVDEAAQPGAAAVRAGTRGESLHHPARSPGRDAAPGRDRPAGKRDGGGARRRSRSCARAPRRPPSTATGNTTLAGTPRSICATC